MAGVAGTTFTSELNRLANGGASYPANGSYFTATMAANVWAGTTGLPLLRALNVKNGSVGVAMNAVCNTLAGTTLKSATDALRSRNA